MRFSKWIWLGLGTIVALVVIGVVVIVWFVDPNSFKPRIETAVREATGRELTLVGDIELGFFPWLSLRTGEGRFGNAPAFGPEPMVTWKSAQLGAKLFPLLSGRLVADRVSLDGAQVHLVRRFDGSANWQGIGSQQPAAAEPDAEPMEVRIDGVQVSNSRVVFTDESAGRRVEVTGLALETDEIAPGEPLTDTEISGTLHTNGFAAAGVPFRVAVPELRAPKDFSSVEVEEFEVAFGVLEAEGAIGGKLGDRLDLRGQIGTEVFDLRALLLSVGVDPPKTADAQALSKLQLSARWTLAGDAVAVEPLTLNLDDTKFTGFFRSAGSQATAEFLLRGDQLAISRYIPPPDPDSEPFVFPTAALKALTVRGSLELERATLGDADMKGVMLRLVMDEQGVRSEVAPTPTPTPAPAATAP